MAEEENGKKHNKSSDAEHLFVYASAKSGMDNVDKERIQSIIYEASKGSAYFENEQRKAAQTEEKMKSVRAQLNQISHSQIEQMQVQCNKYLRQLDSERDLSRTWMHVDMDMFYAAVAMRDNPSLKGKPIAVGSMSMISTTNYIARRYGVRAAMPGFIGKKLCPQLVFVKHDRAAYVKASNKVKEIVVEYDPDFTAGSLDEFYLDITDYLSKMDHSKTGSDIALEIRNKIFAATKLTASAGVACNRMLSKIGSDMNKPNGQWILESDAIKIKSFMKTLNVRKIPGIGKVTQRILKEIAIETCSDVLEKAALVQMFFKPSTYRWLLSACYGIAMNKRDPNEIYQRKSISQERTFSAKGICNEKELEKKIIEICEGLSEEMMEKKIRGKTVTVKIKTTEFETKTRAHSLDFYTNDKKVITQNALRILRKEYPINVRLLGVRMSSLEQKQPQSKCQRQLNDFWKVKKEKIETDEDHKNDKNTNKRELDDDGPENDVKSENVYNGDNKRKRKRNWNEMMQESEIDDAESTSVDVRSSKKRRRIDKNENKIGDLNDIDMKDRIEDVDTHKTQKKDKMTLAQMFDKQKDKKKNKKESKPKLVCPICGTFE